MPTTSSMWVLWECIKCSSSSRICSISCSWSLHKSSTLSPYFYSSWTSVCTRASKASTTIVCSGAGPWGFLASALLAAREVIGCLSPELPCAEFILEAVWGRCSWPPLGVTTLSVKVDLRPKRACDCYCWGLFCWIPFELRLVLDLVLFFYPISRCVLGY